VEEFDSTVGDAVIILLGEELERERTRKSSLEARGLAVITTSGTLVTLLFGVAALATKASSFLLSRDLRGTLIAAAVFFVIAGSLAIAANWPVPYYQIEPSSLGILVSPEAWREDGGDARRELSAARLAELGDARLRNEGKARIVVSAMVAEVVAVVITVAAISETMVWR
jgi:hypothetical protein